MKVFVATAASQGARPDDEFDGCVEGELVWMLPECGRVTEFGEACSCAIGFLGIASHQLTTTVMSRDLPELNRQRFIRLLQEFHEPGCTCFARVPLPVAAHRMLALAARQPTDTVLDRWSGWVGPRFDPVTGALHPALGPASGPV